MNNNSDNGTVSRAVVMKNISQWKAEQVARKEKARHERAVEQGRHFFAGFSQRAQSSALDRLVQKGRIK